MERTKYMFYTWTVRISNTQKYMHTLHSRLLESSFDTSVLICSHVAKTIVKQ